MYILKIKYTKNNCKYDDYLQNYMQKDIRLNGRLNTNALFKIKCTDNKKPRALQGKVFLTFDFLIGNSTKIVYNI